VPRLEISDVFSRCIRALKPAGYWYMSFKWGEGEELRSGRLFNNYTENSLKQALAPYASVQISRMWQTHDLRRERHHEAWANVVVQRKR
jgi:hypothetical protein